MSPTALSETTKKYLNSLHLHHEEPSLDYLSRICLTQLNTFPFENISKLIYYKRKKHKRVDFPSFNEFIKNHLAYDFGGTCYTLNYNLMLFLKELGFDCYLVMLGNVHMGIIVKMGNERFYVDCGAAAPFFKPVPFEKDQENKSQFGNDRVQLLPVDQPNHLFQYVRYTDRKQNGDSWEFNSRNPYTLADFIPIIEKSNQPGATFMTILRCQLYQADKGRCVSLVNNKLRFRYVDGTEKLEVLSSPQEIMDVITEEFGLSKLPVLEAIDILEGLEIDIFSKYHGRV